MARFPSLTVTAAVIAFWCAGAVHASDTTIRVGPTTAGPAIMPGVGCSSCGAAQATHGHACGKPACGMSWFNWHKHKNEPFVVNLCPGACFGYFQPQWRKWDDVCPYPYLGKGVSDAAKPPVLPVKPGSDKPPSKGEPLPGPRPVDPKKLGNDLPPIPVPPG